MDYPIVIGGNKVRIQNWFFTIEANNSTVDVHRRGYIFTIAPAPKYLNVTFIK